MGPPRLAKDPSDYEDLIAPHNIYTPLCLCYPLQDVSSQAQIIDTLAKGLERLSSSFPWLAGQVVTEDIPGQNAKRSTIIPLDKTSRLIVRDLTHDASIPSMDTLRKAKFPVSMLEGNVLTSLKGLPSSFGESEDEPSPVFFIQANFINDGLILSFAAEHSVTDGQGFGQIIQNFSKACNDEPFTDEELFQGNRARTNVVPLLDQATYTPGPELDHLLVKPSVSPPTVSKPPPECAWAYFHFPPSSLSGLKSLAAPVGSILENSTAPYITTNDAVSAFIWQCTSRVRSSHLPPQSTTTFARAVDLRPCLSIPPSYLGNMTNHTYNTLPIPYILSSSLGSLASSLRSALNPSELNYQIRSVATQLSRDISSISFGFDLDLSTDIFFSSWAKLKCYNFDFKLGLGFPESVRRPNFDIVEGLMYLMPTDRSGGVDAALCLSIEDLKGLREDRDFGEYAEWIG